MAADKESWRNATKGIHGVLKYDKFGNEVHEQVRPGQTVQLSTDERLLNMDRAADESLDVFKNGTFVPVRLLDGTEDKAEISSNPNLKSEDELRDLLGLHWQKFEPAVEAITNVSALSRLLEIAQEEDATMRQFRIIESHIRKIDPTYVFEDVDDIQTYGEASDGIKAVTPS